jgi:hypothetical protein
MGAFTPTKKPTELGWLDHGWFPIGVGEKILQYLDHWAGLIFLL